MLMQSIVIVVNLFIFFIFNVSSPEKEPDFELVWVDDFSSTVIDPGKWSFQTGDGCPERCGWGNNELQYYTDKKENARLENGYLIIEARKESVGTRSYSSAKLVTRHKADWKHGKIEIRAKLPYGKGTWPAFWLLDILDATYRGREKNEMA